MQNPCGDKHRGVPAEHAARRAAHTHCPAELAPGECGGIEPGNQRDCRSTADEPHLNVPAVLPRPAVREFPDHAGIEYCIFFRIATCSIASSSPRNRASSAIV